MATLDIVLWPAEVLETKSAPVTQFDAKTRQFVDDMFETMTESNGIGLAANQVGVAKRIITIYIPKDDGRSEKSAEHNGKRLVFINPEIVEKKGKISWQEGCLSFPQLFDYVDRAAKIKVSAQDENGKSFTLEAEGLLAVCIQHEIDHIDGVVFIERMSRLKAQRIRKKMLEAHTSQLGLKQVAQKSTPEKVR